MSSLSESDVPFLKNRNATCGCGAIQSALFELFDLVLHLDVARPWGSQAGVLGQGDGDRQRVAPFVGVIAHHLLRHLLQLADERLVLLHLRPHPLVQVITLPLLSLPFRHL